MKNYIIYTILILFFSSCDHFLEYRDQDKIVPRTLQHYSELVYGEVIHKGQANALSFTNLMTDEAQDFTKDPLYDFVDDKRIDFFSYYTWSPNHELKRDNSYNNDVTWPFFYNKIFTANVLENDIRKLPDESNGNGNDKMKLLAEIKFMRALSYFYLVNLYGEVYLNSTQAQTGLGIPLNNSTVPESNKYNRSSLADVYQLIETDLNESIELFNTYGNFKSIFRPNLDIAKLFLSKVYLFQHKFREAVDLSTDLLTTSSKTIEPLSFFKTIVEKDWSLYDTTNPSILFSWGAFHSLLSDSGYINGKFEVSDKVRNLLKDDIRGTAFFFKRSPFFPTISSRSTRKTTSDICYRITEAYFIRAEANIQLKKFDLAYTDLNYIRENRKEGHFELDVSDTKEEAMSVLQDEKLSEMPYQAAIRWFDVRRWQLSITHSYGILRSDEVEVYRLEPGSPNYSLSIPIDVLKFNDKIEQIERSNLRI